MRSNSFFIFYAVFLAAVVTILYLGISTAIKETEQARIDCEIIAGGHFINQHGRECWTLDGTRRLFPSELF